DRYRAPSRGRAPLVFGPRGGEGAQVERFLRATLAPLLDVSQSRRDAIYAWEVINEPDWVVRGGPLNPTVKKTVSARDMNGLLRAAVERTIEAGFTATIGFKQTGPRWLFPELRAFLDGAARRGEYMHPLHHYPNVMFQRRLPPASASPRGNVFVGEFPTSNVQSLTNGCWADAGLAENDPERYLERRLALIRAQGYRGAFLWSTEPAWLKERRLARGGEYEADSRVRFGDSQRE